MTASAPLLLPEGIRYECVQCGESCRMFEEVYVEPVSEARLREIDFAPLMNEEARGLDPLVPGKQRPDDKMLRKCGNQCVFQNGAGLCSVHAAHGFEQKPQTCQDYPFRFVDTPAGVFAGVTFSCTAVLENSGASITEQSEDIAERLGRARRRDDRSGAVRFTHRHDISWECYASLEADLAAILASQPHGLPACLAAQSIYLDVFEKLLRESRLDAIDRPDRRLPDGAGRYAENAGAFPDAEVLAAVRKRYLANDAAELFKLAERLRPSPALQRAFLGLITAFRQNIHDPGKRPGRLTSAARIARHYLAHALKMGRIDLVSLKEPFDYSAFGTIEFDIASGERRALLARFFGHALFRKDLLLADNVWLGQRYMLMHLALVRWHAVGEAARANSSTVEIEHLRLAIRAVELHYLFHTPFGQFFEKFPSLGIILDRIVRKPAFAASMMGGPR